MYSYIIIDDEPVIRSGIRSKIDSFASSIGLLCVGEAGNGREGLQVIAERDPDMILSDMRMPGIDGQELLARLKSHYPDKPIIVISGYKDYEYMRGAIEAQALGYLLKPFSREEVQAVMVKAIQTIETARRREKLVERIDGLQSEQERMYEQHDADRCRMWIETGPAAGEPMTDLRSRSMRELSQALGYMVIVCYSAEPSDHEGSEHEAGNGRGLCELQAADAGSRLYRIPGRSAHWSYIIAAFQVASDTERAQLALQESLSALSETRLLAASSMKKTLAELHEAYLECRTAMDRCSVHRSCGYVRLGSAHPEQAVGLWEGWERIVFFLERGEREQAQQAFSQLLPSRAIVPEAPPLTWSELKTRGRQFIAAVRLAASRSTLILPADWAQEAETVLESGYDVAGCTAYLYHLLDTVAAPSSGSSSRSAQELVQQIEAYIERHYREEITLTRLSQRFFVNASYCSFIFKEKTGTNLTDFILAKRIAKARELLSETSYSLDSIARMVGYSNAKYFMRLFKKATGMTPQAYRIAHSQSQK
ncbi:DNA-binding response regulator [Paenibacillus sp. 598K]|uniref:response regulator n=1 Tax=Paenibacillus sp. 598K TaxID=1117987 RepID=UPI000FFA82A6|nr:response regulator [Paenibacillus sp. 598K]GBF76135.1 DNA-binding response regulator [Paenibacillus sp. 598K]